MGMVDDESVILSPQRRSSFRLLQCFTLLSPAQYLYTDGSRLNHNAVALVPGLVWALLYDRLDFDFYLASARLYIKGVGEDICFHNIRMHACYSFSGSRYLALLVGLDVLCYFLIPSFAYFSRPGLDLMCRCRCCLLYVHHDCAC